MSWILNPEGDSGGRRVRKRPTNTADASSPASSKAPQSPGSVPSSPWPEFPLKDNYPRVPDPAEPEREVSTKQANRPFLAYAQYREQKQKEHEAWLQRKKEREEKLARGEAVGPEEPDPTEEPEVGCLGLLKFIVISLVVIVMAGKFFTGSYLWEHNLPDITKLIPRNQRLFSERMLSTFTGDVESKPIYLAVSTKTFRLPARSHFPTQIDGDVYDVSSNRRVYGPGGSYHFMAGRDAARAFATGCFATHLTHDIRGLNEREMQVGTGLEHWKKFFADSKKYRKVGRVLHEPIDPMSPVPEPCDPKKAAAQIDKPPVKEEPKRRDEL
ncbi:hypothetical protein EIP86_003137 [Pleurotus ostreatoroseus]|nr:hypothetical protein EIP86_003137 [Pleurotus ostreatoroseus]